MLRKKVAMVCGVMILSLGSMFAVSAEEAAEAATEVTMEAETEAAAVAEVIVLQAEGAEPVEIANEAKLDIIGISVEAAEEEGLVNVALAAKDGTTYEFLNVDYADMQEPKLVVEGAFAYIKYTGIASEKERSVGQTGELVYEETAELFAVDEVYMRAEPNSDAEIVGVINRGDAIEVLGETATHFKVKKDDVIGYSVRRCISEDEQEAIAAVQAESAAREAIRQAEAAAAAAAQSYSQSSSSQNTGSSVYEVKRQKFDDCDGSGHGYYLITYSDGSTGVEEY